MFSCQTLNSFHFLLAQISVPYNQQLLKQVSGLPEMSEENYTNLSSKRSLRLILWRKDHIWTL